MQGGLFFIGAKIGILVNCCWENFRHECTNVLLFSVVGYRLWVVGCGLWVSGFSFRHEYTNCLLLSVLSSRFSVLGYRLWVVGCGFLVSGFKFSPRIHELFIVACRFSVVCYQLSGVGYFTCLLLLLLPTLAFILPRIHELFIVACRFSVLGCLLSVVRCGLFQLPTATASATAYFSIYFTTNTRIFYCCRLSVTDH